MGAQGLEPCRGFEATRIIPSRIICGILPEGLSRHIRELEVEWCVARSRGSLGVCTWKLAWEEAARKAGMWGERWLPRNGRVVPIFSTLHP